MEINFQGLKELNTAIEQLGIEAGAKIYRSAAMDAMQPVKQEMQRRVPVSDTERYVEKNDGGKVLITPGFTKSRIKKRSLLNRKGVVNKRFTEGEIVKVRVGVFRVPYVGHTEFGAPSNNIKPQPFIEPALRAVQSQVVSVFTTRLRHRYALAVKRAAKKAKSIKSV
ncbi:MAG: hypothetical protein KTR20_12835 [Cellvibrionaceae bacterium]|nr:hypothetical protein [Cellvibrionaceae bacterium]